MRISNVLKIFDLRSSSMTNRIIVLVVTIAVIAVFASSYIVFATSIETINNEVLNNIQELAYVHNRDLERFVLDLSDYSLNIRRNADLLRALLADEPPGYHDAVNISKLHNFFYGRLDIYEFILYLPRQGRVYEFSGRNPNLRIWNETGFEEMDWFIRASKGPGFAYVTSGLYEDSQGRSLLTIYRAIINIQDQETIAIVKLNVVFDYMSTITSNEDRIIYIIDESGAVIYDGGAGLPDGASEQVVGLISAAIQEGGNTGSLQVQLDDNVKMAIFATSEELGWSSVFIVEANIAGYVIEDVRGIVLTIAFSAAAISILLIVSLVKSQTRSFEKLLIQVSHIGSDSLDKRLSETGDSEIDGLVSSINAMLDRIYELVEQNFVANINEKEAKLKALESQIDSHFMYNALQAISVKALMSGNREVCSMIDAMTYCLRYLLSVDFMVRLESELAHLDRYFMLQKVRYEERLEVSIDADERALSQFIPKLSIQALAENAVKHGLEKKLGKVSIEIRAFVEDGYLNINVADDGEGMTPQRLAEVKEAIQQTDETMFRKKSIGLQNLVGRLSLFYNGKATFDIGPREGGGVISEIKIPYDN